jgi:hypothetical protein
METLIVKSKDKATAQLLKKLLKEIKGVEKVSVLNTTEKEDIALANAISKGKTGEYIDTEGFLASLKK